MLMTSSVAQYIPRTWNTASLYRLDNLKKEDTYALIFSVTQQKQLDFLKKHKNINILYEGPKAVNKNPGHGVLPRNTLVIFELKD